MGDDPPASVQPSTRRGAARISRRLLVVALVGGLAALSVYLDRQTDSPEALERAAERACVALYARSDPSSTSEERGDAEDYLDYLEDRLDAATDPEVVAIHEYLELDQPEGLVIGQTGDLDVVPSPGMGRRLLERAAEACTNLGHPELERHLSDDEDR